jgi:hypothetical protein
MTRVFADSAVNRSYVFLGSFKQLEKELSVKQKNAADPGFAVFLFAATTMSSSTVTGT